MAKRKDKKTEIKSYVYKGTGLTIKERNRGKKRFAQYMQTYSINKLSDLILLEEKIFREELQSRYKTKIEILAKPIPGKVVKVTTEPVPDYLIRAMDSNLKQILEIDEKLGLFQEKKVDDPFKYFKILEKKFAIWREKNWDSRQVNCPFCQKVFFLKIRTNKYKTLASPFFGENKVLGNKPLIKLYSEGRLTKEEVAEVLNVSSDYVDFLKEIYDKSSS